MILVNQVGKRFYDETQGNWPGGSVAGFLDPYIPGDWRNARRVKYDPLNFIDAALAINEGSTAPEYAPGPTWFTKITFCQSPTDKPVARALGNMGLSGVQVT